jgi:hypothetical protein
MLHVLATILLTPRDSYSVLLDGEQLESGADNSSLSPGTEQEGFGLKSGV